METLTAEIKFFMESTGAPESIAIGKLAENQGNLNDAINAYILEQESKKLKVEKVKAAKEDTGGASSSQQIHVPNDSQQEVTPLTADDEEKMLKSLTKDEEQELSKTRLRELAKKTSGITIVVRMADGGRIDRRFLKTDKVRVLFDFVDIVGFRSTATGLYRLVTRRPRRVYDIEDILSTFEEVGLSNDETLYVEMYK